MAWQEGGGERGGGVGDPKPDEPFDGHAPLRAVRG
jgi:hypothetical protein